MALYLRYAVRSDLGLVRNNNEDSVYAGPRLLAIADGMGGHAAGEVASKIVISTIRPLDDSDHYGVTEFWTVPTDGEGDCEDYVLAKRKMLILLGLPESALRITVALDSRKVRHAVLTIVTDRGDYVLDNAQRDILPAEKTGYRPVERQDAASPTGWVAMN